MIEFEVMPKDMFKMRREGNAPNCMHNDDKFKFVNDEHIDDPIYGFSLNISTEEGVSVRVRRAKFKEEGGIDYFYYKSYLVADADIPDFTLSLMKYSHEDCEGYDPKTTRGLSGRLISDLLVEQREEW